MALILAQIGTCMTQSMRTTLCYPNRNPSKLQIFLNGQNGNILISDMRFTSAVAAVDRPKVELVLPGEELAGVGRISVLGNCTSPDGRMASEVPSSLHRTRLTFANLKRP